MKVLSEFIEHHKLPKVLILPIPGLPANELLARIFDIMAYSMGQEKHDAFVKESKEYTANVGASL